MLEICIFSLATLDISQQEVLNSAQRTNIKKQIALYYKDKEYQIVIELLCPLWYSVQSSKTVNFFKVIF